MPKPSGAPVPPPDGTGFTTPILRTVPGPLKRTTEPGFRAFPGG